MKVYAVCVDTIPIRITKNKDRAKDYAVSLAYELARHRPHMTICGYTPEWSGFNEFADKVDKFDTYLKAHIDNGCGWESKTSITITESYLED